MEILVYLHNFQSLFPTLILSMHSLSVNVRLHFPKFDENDDKMNPTVRSEF